jgi:hypothetical protein
MIEAFFIISDILRQLDKSYKTNVLENLAKMIEKFRRLKNIVLNRNIQMNKFNSIEVLKQF